MSRFSAPIAEAIWDMKYRLKAADGTPLDASATSYTVTFAPGKLPPVKAFWSLTMYDGQTQLLVDNSLNRYLLNSPMMDQFTLNEDGSLTLYIQKEHPGPARESNWLPAPDGPFTLALRNYWPEQAILDGVWEPASIKKI